MNSDLHPTPAATVPLRQLGFGLAAAPAAWALHEALSALVSSWACAGGALELGPLGAGGVRALLALLTLLALALALAGARASWRARTAAPRPSGAAERSWAGFLAVAGLLVSALALVGLVYGGLSALLLSSCGQVR